MTFDKAFYKQKTWGSKAIKQSKDLPTLKIKHAMKLLHGKKGRVLEIGCGSGRILATIKQHNPELELVGIDLDEEQIALAKQHNEGIDFHAGDGEQLPFADESFDYVVFFDFIEHIEHPEQALKEMARVLKNKGKLYGVSPAEAHSIYKLSTKLFGRHFKEETAGHIQQYTRRGLTNKVRGAGFDVEQVKYSYHLLGSLMDYALFTMILHPKIADVWWKKNKYYNAGAEQTAASKVLNACLALGNMIAYYESTALQNVPLTATAIHVMAEKE
ncbi:MAG: class I SAM-dependent methyltransferase [Candidatus Woesearchaeota archaeon]|nr:class I SAM-dependent methyltransferase [Candidatus Woesearchaeota archaeon]